MRADGMGWHVQYRQGESAVIERFQSPELARQAACRLIDIGVDVDGIGTDHLAETISKIQIADIYRLWEMSRFLGE